MEEERAYADYTGHDDDGHGGTETITLAQIRAKYDPPLRYHTSKLQTSLNHVGEEVFSPCIQGLGVTNSNLDRSLKEAKSLKSGLASMEEKWKQLSEEARVCHSRTASLLTSSKQKAGATGQAKSSEEWGKGGRGHSGTQ